MIERANGDVRGSGVVRRRRMHLYHDASCPWHVQRALRSFAGGLLRSFLSGTRLSRSFWELSIGASPFSAVSVCQYAEYWLAYYSGSGPRNTFFQCLFLPAIDVSSRISSRYHLGAYGCDVGLVNSLSSSLGTPLPALPLSHQTHPYEAHPDTNNSTM